MRWRDRSSDWKARFAVLPILVGGEWHWLVPYWSRFYGEYYQTVFERPAGEGR